MSEILVLGIESSCDETAAAVVVNGRKVLSNIIFSQIDIHKKYGGVVPEIASRNHTAKIDSVVSEALSAAGVSLNEISVVAVTNGPGLVGALLVGLSFGKALAFANNLPFVGAHHIEGHVCANYLGNEDFAPPFMCLVVSGGHTHLLHVTDYGKYEILGKTRDDAAGEAYDKVARAIGLPYPGGVEIDKLAKLGNSCAIKFPKALMGGEQLDFSFSGIKSAVLNYINSCEMTKTVYKKEDLAASFQKSVIETLVQKAITACRQKGCKTFAIAGGVASNSELRMQMTDACEKDGIAFHVPSPVFCTDNAAMIASAGYFSYIKGERDGLSLNAYPNLPLV